MDCACSRSETASVTLRDCASLANSPRDRHSAVTKATAAASASQSRTDRNASALLGADTPAVTASTKRFIR